MHSSKIALKHPLISMSEFFLKDLIPIISYSINSEEYSKFKPCTLSQERENLTEITVLELPDGLQR